MMGNRVSSAVPFWPALEALLQLLAELGILQVEAGLRAPVPLGVDDPQVNTMVAASSSSPSWSGTSSVLLADPLQALPRTGMRRLLLERAARSSRSAGAC
jgi:hypothetical protein